MIKRDIWLLDEQKVFLYDVVNWKDHICVVTSTYTRYGFHFLSLYYMDAERVGVHYVEQTTVRVIGRNYKEKFNELST